MWEGWWVIEPVVSGWSDRLNSWFFDEGCFFSAGFSAGLNAGLNAGLSAAFFSSDVFECDFSAALGLYAAWAQNGL